MKRIQILTRIRKIRERQALGDMAGEQRRTQDATRHEDERRIAYREAAEQTSSATDADRLMAANLRQTRSFEQLTEAAAARLQAEQRLSHSRDSWQQASAETDAAEELESRKRQQAAYVARRSADRALDELMALQHRRRRK